MFTKILKIFIILILVFAIAVSTFLFMPQKARAILGIGDPFGGMVITNIRCDASLNNWVTVGPPKPMSIMVDPLSVVYRNFNYSTGHWVLGLADGFEPCLKKVCFLFYCTVVPIGGGERVRIMGTS